MRVSGFVAEKNGKIAEKVCFIAEKDFFTNRVRLSVVTDQEKFEDVVEYEGSINSIFNTVKLKSLKYGSFRLHTT